MNPALFAVDTWKISDRVAVDLEFCQNFNSQFGNYLNPSLGSRWEITPNLALHAAVAGAQRNPGLDQLYLYDTVHGWFPNQDLKPETGATWSAFTNYTYTDAKIQTGAELGLQLALLPYSVAQLGIGYANRGWEVNLLTNYNAGTRRAFFGNPGQTNTSFVPSFLNLDLGARIPVGENVGINLYVENLADVQYEKVNRIYSPGRTYRVGVSANF